MMYIEAEVEKCENGFLVELVSPHQTRRLIATAAEASALIQEHMSAEHSAIPNGGGAVHTSNLKWSIPSGTDNGTPGNTTTFGDPTGTSGTPTT